MPPESQPQSVAAYLAALPPDRRAALKTLRAVIRKNLDHDYAEGIQYGMIGYFVPHRVYPAGYHCDPTQPLPFAAIGAQKNHLSLHMMCLYTHTPQPGGRETPFLTWFKNAWAKTGKKLNMGKACIRFQTADDLALDVIAAAFRKVPTKKFIAQYQTARAATAKKSRVHTAKSGIRKK